MNTILTLLWERPARLVSASFIAVALLGASLLSIPAATTAPGGLPFLDALFTATSAVCVTGLIVVDTATAFTPLGQGVILALIQMGGLGIMAFAISTVFLVRRRLTMSEAELLSFMLNERNRHVVVRQLGNVFVVALVVEFIGAVLLAIAFMSHGQPPGQAAWYGVFHAVSAFANAGFALFSNSLEQFVHAPLVNGVVMILIILGGIGFGTLLIVRNGRHGVDAPHDGRDEMIYQPRIGLMGHHSSLRDRLRKPRALSVRVAVVGTALLLVAGAVLFYVLEARNSLLGMSIPQKYLASLFQAVTFRTAGFNTVSFSDVSRTTLLIAVPFMFIGGASGGTAGGIKIGTVAVLVAEFRRFFFHHRDATLFQRRLPGRLVTQATILLIVGLVTVLVATIILSFTESAPLEIILFEVVSALGTVGLSAGLTGELSGGGRIVVIVLMLIGRLGPLTLFAMFRPEGKPAALRLPEGEIPVG
ncbi:MAG TPA: potassium transporter TrkG [Alkalispirochaeta sp.]|nr:potassium transporter TrkG [Alkalispirochaeta sp.]